MDLSTVLMGVAALSMAGALSYQIKTQKKIETNYQKDLDALSLALKMNTDEKEVMRLLRILRTCGFSPVVNPNLESHRDQATRNLWYFKAAMKIKDHDMDWFCAEQYANIKSIMPVNIPSTISKESCDNYRLEFEVMRDILPLAAMLYEHIEGMTQEVFGDAGTHR